MNDLKQLLDDLHKQYNVPGFIERDPISFLYRYEDARDREVAGLLTSIITWGRRQMILKSGNRMFSMMGVSPYDFVMNADLEEYDANKAVHRTFNEGDFAFICRGLRTIYQNQESLEPVFNQPDLFEGIAAFYDLMNQANEGFATRSMKHVSNPASKSACKKMFLFLRWMVRNDGIVDLGIWKNISPSKLYIPLDVHVGNVSRELNLLTRKLNDRKSVEELTCELRGFDPNDPVKYDFALFGYGEEQARHGASNL